MENNQGLAINTQVYVKKAKVWRIAFFALNNASTNLILCMMGYVTYYASDIAGLLLLLIAYTLTSMRVFDAITDPIVGYLIDKLNFGKLGKFRPWILIGHIIMCTTILMLYNTVHLVPSSIRFIYFIMLYGVYIIGYTCQTTCTKAAQSVLTKDPSQRPLFTLFDSFFCLFVFGGTALYVSSYLQVKHGGFTLGFFNEFSLTAIVLATICTLLALIGLWGEDIVPRQSEINTKTEKVRVRDYIDILKKNKAIRTLVICAGIDKLAGQCLTNAITCVIVFGILIGDYSMYGKMTVLSAIPIILIVSIGTKVSQKKDMRKTVLISNSIAVFVLSTLVMICLFGDTQTISFSNPSLVSILFITLFSIERGLQMFGTNLFIPMIADCTDYEEYLTGRKVPGMIGTLYSMIDKLVSSLAVTVVTMAVAWAGFSDAAPTVDTMLTEKLRIVGAFCAFGIPIFAALCVIIGMLHYPLTKEKMKEVQMKINQIEIREE